MLLRVCVSYFHTISKLFIFIRFIVPSPMSTLTGLDTLLYFPKLYHTLLYSVHACSAVHLKYQKVRVINILTVPTNVPLVTPDVAE